MTARFLLMIIRVTLVAAVLTTTYLAISASGPAVSAQINDKFAHLFAFYVLAALADFSFPNRGYDLFKILPLVGYGLLIELIQLSLPYRDASMMDLIVDTAGLLLYGLAASLLRRTPLGEWRRTFARRARSS